MFLYLCYHVFDIIHRTIFKGRFIKFLLKFSSFLFCFFKLFRYFFELIRIYI
nr:MAG TPA: hypothetical protein [Caudoviricetes sp.]